MQDNKDIFQDIETAPKDVKLLVSKKFSIHPTTKVSWLPAIHSWITNYCEYSLEEPSHWCPKEKLIP